MKRTWIENIGELEVDYHTVWNLDDALTGRFDEFVRLSQEIIRDAGKVEKVRRRTGIESHSAGIHIYAYYTSRSFKFDEIEMQDLEEVPEDWLGGHKVAERRINLRLNRYNTAKAAMDEKYKGLPSAGSQLRLTMHPPVSCRQLGRPVWQFLNSLYFGTAATVVYLPKEIFGSALPKVGIEPRSAATSFEKMESFRGHQLLGREAAIEIATHLRILKKMLEGRGGAPT